MGKRENIIEFLGKIFTLEPFFNIALYKFPDTPGAVFKIIGIFFLFIISLSCIPFLRFLALFYLLIALILFDPMRKKIKELGGQSIKSGVGILAVDNKQITIKYQHFRGGPDELRISTFFPSGTVLTIRKKTSEISKLEMSDLELNNKFYFECDAPEFLQKLFSNSQVKPLVLNILSSFSSIEITKNACTFIKHDKPILLKDLSKEDVFVAARKLFAFIDLIPQITPDLNPEMVSLRIWRSISDFLVGVSILTGALFFMGLGLSRDVKLRRWFWCFSLIFLINLAANFIVYLIIKSYKIQTVK